MFQILTTYPEFNNIIRPYIAMAPIAYFNLLRALLTPILMPILKYIVSHKTSHHYFIFNRAHPIILAPLILPPQIFKYVTRFIAKTICSIPGPFNLCELFIFLLGGFDYHNNNEVSSNFI